MRQFLRHPADIPIEVLPADGVERQQSHLHNVGLGGLACESAVRLDNGALVSIRIPFTSPPFETTGQVAWCRSTAGGGFEIGIRFASAEDAFRARMVEQVCHIEDYRNKVREKEGRELTPEEAALEWIRRYAANFP